MKKQILLTIGLTALLATATQASQEQLAQGIKDAQGETARTSEQLKATLGALNELTKQKKGNLRPAYDAYCAEVVKTQAAADWTVSRIQSMTVDGERYFASWQKEVIQISNASLRKKSQKRLNAVKANYNEILTALTEAGEKFKPFLSDLGDIQKTLAADVTAGGVEAIKSTVKSANSNHKNVEKSINTALKEMGKLAKALSTEA